MRRRICLAASMVGVAAIGVGGVAASAAFAAPSAKSVKKLVLRCTMTMTVAPPADSPAVPQPPVTGWQYGHTLCPKTGYGSGAVASPFNVPLSGDTVGSYTQYFPTGEIKGKFDLVPQEGDISNFTAESWTGTITVTGGTGVYKGIRSLKSQPGTFVCSSPDTVHLSCTERIKVKPAPSA